MAIPNLVFLPRLRVPCARFQTRCEPNRVLQAKREKQDKSAGVPLAKAKASPRDSLAQSSGSEGGPEASSAVSPGAVLGMHALRLPPVIGALSSSLGVADAR